MLCSLHYLEWQESMLLLHTCLHSWMKATVLCLILSTSTSFKCLAHSFNKEAVSFHLLQTCSVGIRPSQWSNMLVCTLVGYIYHSGEVLHRADEPELQKDVELVLHF